MLSPRFWKNEFSMGSANNWSKVQQVMAFHAKDPDATLGQISNEFLSNPVYGGGCKY